MLQNLAQQMISNLCDEAEEYSLVHDELSASSGIHVKGTEGQSESPLWHEIRAFRITGTSFKDYANHPEKMAAALWATKRDLSHLKSIKWGKEKEDVARKDYEEKTGMKVTCCGIFVSRKCPVFAASPDGIVLCPNGRILIEIKCPFSLKDNDLSAPQNLKCAFLDSSLSLKKSHQYFYQIQLGMYVTGCKLTHFIV